MMNNKEFMKRDLSIKKNKLSNSVLMTKTQKGIRFKLLIISFLFQSFFIFSQNSNQNLFDYLKNADKIVLASHEDLDLTIEKPGKSKTTHRFLLNKGKPNNKIITKKINLDSESRLQLIEILEDHKSKKNWDGAYCFSPHHAIFIYHSKKWLFIDFCFGCDHYNNSNDLKINNEEFLPTYKDWRKLEKYFREKGLDQYLKK
jgi:hypothetical protein